MRMEDTISADIFFMERILKKYFLYFLDQCLGIERFFAIEYAILLPEVMEEVLEEHSSRLVESIFLMKICEKQTEEFLVFGHDHIPDDINLAVSFLGNDREQISGLERIARDSRENRIDIAGPKERF